MPTGTMYRRGVPHCLELRHPAIAVERNNEQYLLGAGNLAHLLVLPPLFAILPSDSIHRISQ